MRAKSIAITARTRITEPLIPHPRSVAKIALCMFDFLSMHSYNARSWSALSITYSRQGTQRWVRGIAMREVRDRRHRILRMPFENPPFVILAQRCPPTFEISSRTTPSSHHGSNERRPPVTRPWASDASPSSRGASIGETPLQIYARRR